MTIDYITRAWLKLTNVSKSVRFYFIFIYLQKVDIIIELNVKV